MLVSLLIILMVTAYNHCIAELVDPKYVTHKQYDTSYGDIVPFIMSNAICINFMIIIQLADSYRVQLVECVANDRPTLLLFKSAEARRMCSPS